MRPWTSDRTACRSGSNCKQVKESGLLKHPDSAHSSRQCRLQRRFERFMKSTYLWVGYRACGSVTGVAVRLCPRVYGEMVWVASGVTVEKERSEPDMAKAEQTRETKRKFALWIRESSLDMAKQLYKEDNCASQSEFIEKAILFYAGYLLSGKSNRYLPNIITSTLKGIVDESDNRMSRMLFKLAVELAITMNLIAAAQDIDRVTLERLRGECVTEVKRINGAFSFDDAVDWQKG